MHRRSRGRQRVTKTGTTVLLVPKIFIERKIEYRKMTTYLLCKYFVQRCHQYGLHAESPKGAKFEKKATFAGEIFDYLSQINSKKKEVKQE